MLINYILYVDIDQIKIFKNYINGSLIKIYMNYTVKQLVNLIKKTNINFQMKKKNIMVHYVLLKKMDLLHSMNGIFFICHLHQKFMKKLE